MCTLWSGGLPVMKKNHLTREKLGNWVWGYVMILPLMAGLGVFYFYPVVKVIRDSFYNVGAFNKSTWAVLVNYEKMLSDS